VKIPIIASLTILSFLIAIPLATPIARADQGVVVTDASNQWSPYGPVPLTGGIQKILFSYYNGPDKEFQDFELGHLDLPDAQPNGVPPSSWAAYGDSTPGSMGSDFVLSPVQGQFGDFGIYFNMLSARFRAWGCNWNKGLSDLSAITNPNGNGVKDPGFVSNCGLDMREAFAHLLDRQSVVNDGPLTGAGQALSDPSPPAKSPPGSPLATQCAWDTLPQYHNNCVFAFHTGGPCSGGFCTDPSQPDFCAAVSYMIQANADSGGALGLQRDASAPLDAFGFHCGIDPASSGLANIAAHPMLMMIRNNDPNRLYMGDGLRVAINTLFTTTVTSPTYGTIANFRPVVFNDGLLGGNALWDSYTYGYGLGGPFPDHVYGLYNSIFASNFCGGRQLKAPPNPTFDCIPSLDAHSAAAITTGDINTFIAQTLLAFNDFGSHVLDLPSYTPGLRTVVLKSALGLVNQLGFGYNNAFSLLSMHKSGTAPSNSKYAFGGSNPSILRYGQSGATTQLNVFNAQTVWEVQLVGEIYDTIFALNPVVPSQIFCWMCSSYIQSVDAFGNTHFLLTLNPDLRWQGTNNPVTAHDVAFSLYNQRDFSSLIGSGTAGFLLNSTSVIDQRHIDIVMSGVSVDWLPILSGPVVIPSYIWEATSGPGSAGTPQAYNPALSGGSGESIGIVDPAKTSLSYDPMNAHTLIGSSTFACVDVTTGQVGGGCALNADGVTKSGQAIPPGGTALLTRYDFTAPGSPGYIAGNHANQWIRTYNPAWSTGSGDAASSGLVQEVRWADYNTNDFVTGQDLVQVAGCSGLTASTGSTTGACPSTLSGVPFFGHWQKTAFETGTGIGPEITTVATLANAKSGLIWPDQWTGLTNISPRLPGS
jgi:hypothetical protein